MPDETSAEAEDALIQTHVDSKRAEGLGECEASERDLEALDEAWDWWQEHDSYA